MTNLILYLLIFGSTRSDEPGSGNWEKCRFDDGCTKLSLHFRSIYLINWDEPSDLGFLYIRIDCITRARPYLLPGHFCELLFPTLPIFWATWTWLFFALNFVKKVHLVKIKVNVSEKFKTCFDYDLTNLIPYLLIFGSTRSDEPGSGNWEKSNSPTPHVILWTQAFCRNTWAIVLKFWI